MGHEGRARPVVAIDGPSGAGKSTVGRRLAARLGFQFIDTGAIYRVLALEARRCGIPWGDGAGLASLVEVLPIGFQNIDGVTRVLLRGRDCSDAMRTEALGLGASTVSRHPAVRAGLLDLQRQLGVRGGIVMDGRDIGTVVFPDAEFKFFLIADHTERARRRLEELKRKGIDIDLEQVSVDLRDRDRADMEREVAPLVRAEDALEIDTTGLSVADVVTKMAEEVGACQAGGRGLWADERGTTEVVVDGGEKPTSTVENH